jgi:hypothetical protein
MQKERTTHSVLLEVGVGAFWWGEHTHAMRAKAKKQ